MANDNNRKVFLIYRIIACLAFLVLLVRLFIIAIEGFGIQKSLYSDPKVAREVIRGEIRDRNGNLLAIQTGQYALFFVMRNIKSIPAIITSVIQTLNQSISTKTIVTVRPAVMILGRACDTSCLNVSMSFV